MDTKDPHPKVMPIRSPAGGGQYEDDEHPVRHVENAPDPRETHRKLVQAERAKLNLL